MSLLPTARTSRIMVSKTGSSNVEYGCNRISLPISCVGGAIGALGLAQTGPEGDAMVDVVVVVVGGNNRCGDEKTRRMTG